MPGRTEKASKPGRSLIRKEDDNAETSAEKYREKNADHAVHDFIRHRAGTAAVREIGMAAGLQSTSTTAGYLRRMVNEGLLAKSGQARRTYFVTRYAAEQLRNAG